ncbi:MAG: hypothetical protein ACRDT4_15200 [Micromonosporaceae bacterium]
MDEAGTRQLAIRGDPGRLAYPDICANCGAATRERLLVEKVFHRSYIHEPSFSVVYGVGVPFCPTCAGRHRTELPQTSPVLRLLTLLRTPLMITSGAFTLFTFLLLPDVLRRVTGDNPRSALLLGAFTAGFALIAALALMRAWSVTRAYRVPEPTSITGAFDFDDDEADTFEREWHTYRLANPVFAAAFATANARRVRQADPGELRRRSRLGCLASAGDQPSQEGGPPGPVLIRTARHVVRE